ncbi:hypothetical protein [Amycolatopsis albispora]|uniref:Uncharacterized protein n=1 Tax=Amycolatopsis albispora TaxID=1804986 RepID=A0A344L6W9_9PSEU|nr:hypothetical protein [Amycolatopsis albispora]AXB43793.1 hypothetical protein A4R43_15720 [Amycolatopsis albispora]
MTEWPPGATRNKLLLSFAWPVPMSTAEAEAVFRPGRGLLEPLGGRVGTEWSVAEGFLTSHGEPPDRYRFTVPLAIGEGDSSLPCGLTVTWHPAYHAMTLLVTATISGRGEVLETSDVDRTIAILHSLHHRRSEPSGLLHGRYRDERYPSLRSAVERAFGELVDGCGVRESLDRNGWCVELRGYDGRPPDATVAADPRPFYGLAHGDEGWRFVPREVARQSLGEAWGTRSFVAMYPVSAGIVCLNNKGTVYSAHQTELARRYFGKAEPYFELDTEIGGLDHGGLLVLERVLIRMALAHQWLHRAQRELAEAADESRAVNRHRLLRGSLDDILQMLNSVLPPEVDSLERRLITNMGVERIVRQLDRQAEAMDEETRYAYESTVSNRVTRLTVVTVILTVVTIVLGILQVVFTV